MKIAANCEQGKPVLEVSLGVLESRVVTEAVGLRVLALVDMGEAGSISSPQAEIIECSADALLDMTLDNCSDTLARDLESHHASTGAAVDAIFDDRHNSSIVNKWESAARRRVKFGKKAIAMASKLRDAQAKQDLRILRNIDALGLFDGFVTGEGEFQNFARTCRDDEAAQGSLPPCPNSNRRQRRAFRVH